VESIQTTIRSTIWNSIDCKTSRLTTSLQIDESWRRQVDQFQDDSKMSRPNECRSQRKIESENTSWSMQVEMTKVEFLKSFFFQVKSVQEISNPKVKVEEKLNTIQVEAEARWVD
jgi:hypothetical protein